MNSYDIYISSLLEEEDASRTIQCSGKVHQTFYEYDQSGKFYSELLQIGRVLFLSRKVYYSDFQLMCKSSSYLIIYVVSGGVYAECGAKKFSADSGQALVLKDDKTYCITQQSEMPLDVVVIWCKGDMPMSYSALLKEMCVTVAQPEAFLSLLDELSYFCQYNNNYSQAKSIAYIAQLFCHLLQENTFSVCCNKKRTPDTILYAVALLDEKFNSDICIDDLAQVSGFSKIQFYRLFKSCTGMTPYMYLINKRIDTAKTLLLTTNYKVKLISQMVGYYSVSHFIKHFKRHTSQTPQEYRNNSRL